MRTLTRRTAMQLGAGAAALASQVPALPGLPSPPVGRVRARRTKEIAASPLGIGFETLDRETFEPQPAYSHLAELGAKWARVQTGWARTERSRGEYDFRWLDGIVDSLLAAGVQPWFNLGYGNQLYTPEAPHVSAVGYVPLNTTEATQAWLRYVARIAEHFKNRVTRWEIWNEPNSTGFWRPNKPDGASYAGFVKITAPEIRKRIRGAVIVGAALAGLAGTFDFLERALDAGLADLVDVVSYHPYRANPDANYTSEVRALRCLLARYKPDLPIWQGENGCPSQYQHGYASLGRQHWTEEAQSKWLLRRVLGDLGAGVQLTSYFHAMDRKSIQAQGDTGFRTFYGVLRADYTRKLSFQAYQCVCNLFDSETQRTDLMIAFNRGKTWRDPNPVGANAIYSAAFARRGRPLYIYWLPAELLEPFTPQLASVQLWSGKDLQLEQPVLIDPLSGGQIYPLEAARKNGGFWNLGPTPVADYPLILTDRSLAA